LVTFNPKEIVMVRKLLPTTLVLLSLSMGAAFAGPAIVYGDLNIARPADASTLAERVSAAAAAYCAAGYEARHMIAPAFAGAASAACIKQVSHNALVEIRAVKGPSPQLALR
jgi:UrcA family protein